MFCLSRSKREVKQEKSRECRGFSFCGKEISFNDICCRIARQPLLMTQPSLLIGNRSLLIADNLPARANNLLLIAANLLSGANNLLFVTNNLLLAANNSLFVTNSFLLRTKYLLFVLNNLLSITNNSLLVITNLLSGTKNLLLLTDNLLVMSYKQLIFRQKECKALWNTLSGGGKSRAGCSKKKFVDGKQRKSAEKANGRTGDGLFIQDG